MTTIRTVLSIAKRKVQDNLLVDGHKYVNIAATAAIIRPLSTKEVTKNISVISNEDRGVKVNNLELTPPRERPLVIMPTWLMAKKKHINKYAKIYLDQGFDVMNISITPWQLLWPVKGTQVVAKDILKFLDVNKNYEPLLLHGFSVGGYLWGEVMVQMAAKRSRYEYLINKIVGQIWDSAADITEISIGVPIAVFPNNQVMQSALRSYMMSAAFQMTLTGVYWKCWDKSPHVGHMAMYPDEYLAEVYNFLDKLGLMSVREKIKAKI